MLTQCLGMYHWAAVLSPPKWAPFLSWITGWNTIWAYITSVASVCCVSASQIVALASLANGNLVVERWHIFLGLELLNLGSLCLVIFGNRIIPTLQKVSIWWYMASGFVVSVTILAMAPTHRTAAEVFTQFINNTGWSTDGMAFISGLVNP